VTERIPGLAFKRQRQLSGSLRRTEPVSNRALIFGNKGQSHPRWSPDGKWIEFLSGREDENEILIRGLIIAGTGPKRVITFPFFAKAQQPRESGIDDNTRN
jgi:hypothetical protein